MEQPALEAMLNDASIDRVMAVNPALKVIAWNKTAEIITGLPRNAVIGRFLPDIFPWLATDEAMRDAFDAALQGHKSYLPADATQEHRSFYESHFIPLTDAAGNLHGVMNIMHDVSHRIKAELALSKLNARLEAKYNELQGALSEIASYTFITSNNIKEPLKQVYTSLEKIIRTEGAALSDSSKASFRRMQTSISRMNLLLDDILSVSGINSFLQKKQLSDLNGILVRVKAALAEKITEKNAAIVCDALPEFYGYPEMLFQLFYHIVDNAVKFQPPGRTPLVKISHSFILSKDAVHQDKTFLQIVCSDNGIGFEPSEKEKIFQLFEKGATANHFSGTGRGLAVCRKIAEMHGGSIAAGAVPGAGSVFTILLPTGFPDEEPHQLTGGSKQIIIPKLSPPA